MKEFLLKYKIMLASILLMIILGVILYHYKDKIFDSQTKPNLSSSNDTPHHKILKLSYTDKKSGHILTKELTILKDNLPIEKKILRYMTPINADQQEIKDTNELHPEEECYQYKYDNANLLIKESFTFRPANPQINRKDYKYPDYYIVYKYHPSSSKLIEKKHFFNGEDEPFETENLEYDQLNRINKKISTKSLPNKTNQNKQTSTFTTTFNYENDSDYIQKESVQNDKLSSYKEYLYDKAIGKITQIKKFSLKPPALTEYQNNITVDYKYDQKKNLIVEAHTNTTNNKVLNRIDYYYDDKNQLIEEIYEPNENPQNKKKLNHVFYFYD